MRAFLHEREKAGQKPPTLSQSSYSTPSKVFQHACLVVFGGSHVLLAQIGWHFPVSLESTRPELMLLDRILRDEMGEPSAEPLKMMFITSGGCNPLAVFMKVFALHRT